MNGYLLVALIWASVAGMLCLFVHGAKKCKRSMDAVDEARSSINWPVSN